LKSLTLLFLLCATAFAQTFTTLASFNGSNGATPTTAPLLADFSGNLWGMTQSGGANNAGTVFEIPAGGSLTTIYSFCSLANCADGSTPMAGLASGPNGNLWGTTSQGGANHCGTLFEITSAGLLTTIHSFCANATDGAIPESTPYYLYNTHYGQLVYVPTSAGGASGFGSIWVWSVTQNGYEVITNFYGSGSDIQSPVGNIVPASQSNYNAGVASAGGINDSGAVYGLYGNKIQFGYTFCQKANCADGANPGPYLAVDGNKLFGVTANGGANSKGTLFALNTAEVGRGSQFFTAYNFCSLANCADGSNPIGGLALGDDSAFYGTTSAGGANGEGTIYKLSGNRTTVTTLYSFCAIAGCPDGQNPTGGLTYSNGVVYGTTATGGANGMGTIYSLARP
jgi:uncharacterized repeat protein (TIGR03803 family)